MKDEFDCVNWDFSTSALLTFGTSSLLAAEDRPGPCTMFG